MGLIESHFGPKLPELLEAQLEPDQAQICRQLRCRFIRPSNQCGALQNIRTATESSLKTYYQFSSIKFRPSTILSIKNRYKPNKYILINGCPKAEIFNTKIKEFVQSLQQR